MDQFDYNAAFSRNLGFVSEIEQQILRTKKIAIAGMGGVGGINFLTSVRLGIENFHITDFDKFELVNFNRQVGATMSSIDHMKADVLIRMAKDINPTLNVQNYPNGVNSSNINQFLDGVDLFFDCIDLFCTEARRLVYAECCKRKIPVIFSVPLGMGFAQVISLPGKMSLEEYFQFDKDNSAINPIKTLLGVSPRGLHIDYIMDNSRVNLEKKKGPSTIMGCQFCAGAAVTEALKILLNRGNVYSIPYSLQYDGYRNKYVRTYMPYGNRNPIQKLRIFFAKKMLLGKVKEYPYPNLDSSNPIENILNLARWAPSAHNSQKWEFSDINESGCTLCISSTNIPGPSFQKEKVNFFHAGVMLEAVKIAASYYNYDLIWNYIPNEIEGNDALHFSLNFKKNVSMSPDPLSQFLKARYTDRRPYKTKQIDRELLARLKQSVSPNHEVIFSETLKDKWNSGLLDAKAQKVMMLHPKLIHFFSEESLSKENYPTVGLPLGTLNISYVSKLMFQYILKKPKLFHFITHYFKGYLYPLFKVSIIPNLFSGAQFSIVRLNKTTPENKDHEKSNAKYFDYIEDGQVLLRFWLTCTQQGISMCPSYLAILLSDKDTQEYYLKDFEKNSRLLAKLSKDFHSIHSDHADDVIFSGRIGYPQNHEIKSRSVRLSLSDLIKESES